MFTDTYAGLLSILNIHPTNCRSTSAKGKRAQKKTSKTDRRESLEGKAASASEDVENRSDISNAEPTVSSGSDGLESGNVLILYLPLEPLHH